MSYGIIRVQRISVGAVGGIQIHNRREKNGVSHSNKDIDWDRTHLNYSLCPSIDNNSYHQLIQRRIKEGFQGTKAIRKDAVKLCEALFTSDSSFFDTISIADRIEFFKDCYSFACEKYGKENIISAVVHLDERTPHLHIDFVPLTSDGRLSAKDVLGNKAALQQLQDDFYAKVSKKWGLERGERGSSARHLSVMDMKIKTAQEELDSIQRQAEKIETYLKEHTSEQINIAQIAQIDAESENKGLIKRYRQLPEKQYQQLIRLAESGVRASELERMNEQLQKKVAEQAQSISKLGVSVRGAQDQNHKLRNDCKALNKENNKLVGLLNGLMSALQKKLPPQQYEELAKLVYIEEEKPVIQQGYGLHL